MQRLKPTQMTGVRWLQACLLLVMAVVGHDVLMASSGQHVPQVAVESTCEPTVPSGHHGHHTPEIEDSESAPVEMPADCDTVRVVAPVKRLVETGASTLVAILPTMSPVLDLAVESVPIESDWLARDPHGRRALWQVYRI
jgi:hypothetical protein